MRKTVIAIVSIALVLAAIGLARILILTAPKAERKRPPKMALPVDTIPLQSTNETVVLHLTGTVTPAEEIALGARVFGEIISVAPGFVDGGLLAQGEQILQIDPTDYELALASAESALEQARFEYKLELGRQDVAKREWELLKTSDATEQERELALRLPHLAANKAALKAAEAAVKRAKLNLERTTIKAPFNAVVLDRNTYIGSQVSTVGQLARLVGTDTYWVTVSIPVDRLSWVQVPGSMVRIISPSGAERNGRVIKLLANLETRGRMARLLVEVEDPLCRKSENAGKKPLLIGEFVNVEISGYPLKNIYSIPRNALHENRFIWTATDGKLDIQEVEVVWRDAEQVLVRNGIKDGELLIISDLTTPIRGMDVNTGTDSKKPVPTPEN